MTTRYALLVEGGGKRTFAAALDWPGWSRSGKGEVEALAALVAYGPRYAAVAQRAGEPFAPPAATDELEVVERRKGGAGTDFGVPSVSAAADDAPVSAADLERLTRILRASWETFDAAARAANGVTLTVGPRGGGRSLDKIVAHAREADEAYLGALGAKLDPAARAAPSPEPLRTALLEALSARVEGRPQAIPRNTKAPWSPRYFVRRAAWHALDHAWELEDRATPR